MNNEFKAKELKSSINSTLESLGLTSKWLAIAGLVFDVFKGGKYQENDGNSLSKLATLIRKNIVDDSRNKVDFLETLDNALKHNDYITKLCMKYLNEFRDNKYIIPENDLKTLRERANNGHRLAQRIIGDHYRYGGNFSIPNIMEAHKYYSYAFENGCYISSYYLGEIYSNKYSFFHNNDLACSYYSYSLLFYFEGDRYFEFIKGKDFILSYLKSRKDLFLSSLEDLLKKDKEISCIKADKFNNNEDLENIFELPIIKDNLYYLYHKIKNIYLHNNQIKTVLGWLGKCYQKNDDGFFLLSLFGSICGDLESIWHLAFAFRIGKGVEKDLNISLMCYLILLEIGRGTHWEIKVMAALALIQQNIQGDNITKEFQQILEDMRPYFFIYNKMKFEESNNVTKEEVDMWIRYLAKL